MSSVRLKKDTCIILKQLSMEMSYFPKNDHQNTSNNINLQIEAFKVDPVNKDPMHLICLSDSDSTALLLHI